MDVIKQLVLFIIKLHGKIIIFDCGNTHGFSFEGFWVFSRFIYLLFWEDKLQLDLSKWVCIHTSAVSAF